MRPAESPASAPEICGRPGVPNRVVGTRWFIRTPARDSGASVRRLRQQQSQRRDRVPFPVAPATQCHILTRACSHQSRLCRWAYLVTFFGVPTPNGRRRWQALRPPSPRPASREIGSRMNAVPRVGCIAARGHAWVPGGRANYICSRYRAARLATLGIDAKRVATSVGLPGVCSSRPNRWLRQYEGLRHLFGCTCLPWDRRVPRERGLCARQKGCTCAMVGW